MCGVIPSAVADAPIVIGPCVAALQTRYGKQGDVTTLSAALFYYLSRRRLLRRSACRRPWEHATETLVPGDALLFLCGAWAWVYPLPRCLFTRTGRPVGSFHLSLIARRQVLFKVRSCGTAEKWKRGCRDRIRKGPGIDGSGDGTWRHFNYFRLFPLSFPLSLSSLLCFSSSTPPRYFSFAPFFLALPALTTFIQPFLEVFLFRALFPSFPTPPPRPFPPFF